MSEQGKLLSSMFMAAVGLFITLDMWRILHVPKQPGRRTGKPVGPVQSPAVRT